MSQMKHKECKLKQVLLGHNMSVNTKDWLES